LFQQVCVGIFSAIVMVVGLMGMMSKSSKQKRIVGKEKDSQQQEDVAKKIEEHNKKVLPIAKLPSLQLSAFRHFPFSRGAAALSAEATARSPK